MSDHSIQTGPEGLRFHCGNCGWTGRLVEVHSWDIQPERNRAVRRCPECDTVIPEWGTIQSLEGLATVARGDLKSDIEAALEG